MMYNKIENWANTCQIFPGDWCEQWKCCISNSVIVLMLDTYILKHNCWITIYVQIFVKRASAKIKSTEPFYFLLELTKFVHVKNICNVYWTLFFFFFMNFSQEICMYTIGVVGYTIHDHFIVHFATVTISFCCLSFCYFYINLMISFISPSC